MPHRTLLWLSLLIATELMTSSPRVAGAESNPGERPSRSNNMDFATLVDGNNRFAFGLYQRLRAGDANLFFSPASISTALGMAYAGASGETATEMAKALHFELPMKQLNEAMRALQESWKAEGNKGYRLDVANRL